VKLAGHWVYLNRAIDQYGQVIDVLLSEKRDWAATRRFFTRARDHGTQPSAVTRDKASAYPRVLDELVPAACHLTEQYGCRTSSGTHPFVTNDVDAPSPSSSTAIAVRFRGVRSLQR
jgi:transposase, IS6 family